MNIVCQTLRSFPKDPKHWLYCIVCSRFFQARDARRDFLGGREGCAFEGCSGAGYQVGIHDWDVWGKGDPAWPKKEQLVKGLVAPSFQGGDPRARVARAALLDRDVARRDEILGIREVEPCEGARRFVELDIVGLAQLLRERFIHPDEQQTHGPSTVEVLCFLASHPEVRVHGRAVDVGRDDYRVTIEGLSCSLDAVPETRREELREAFWGMTMGADEEVDEEDRLYARWD